MKLAGIMDRIPIKETTDITGAANRSRVGKADRSGRLDKSKNWARQELLSRFRQAAYIYREKPFRLVSGRTSHHYFDCKKITLDPPLLALLARHLRDDFIPTIVSQASQDFRAAGGLSIGADPIAYALSFSYWEKGRLLYPVIVRKEAKGHGTNRRIETIFAATDEDREVLLLEDVVTSGSSALLAVSALREAGYTVRYCAAIIDRQEGGEAALTAQNVALHSLFQASEFY